MNLVRNVGHRCCLSHTRLQQERTLLSTRQVWGKSVWDFRQRFCVSLEVILYSEPFSKFKICNQATFKYVNKAIDLYVGVKSSIGVLKFI